MKILITGATGFVGKTLVPYLHKGNRHKLALLVRNTDKAERMFTGMSDIEIISTADEWNKRIESFNPEAVLHLATYFSGKSDFETAKDIIKTNLLFSTQLLESITHTECRYFVNAGTFSEFQNGAGIYHPNNLYSASKTALRPIIQFYQSVARFKWINVVVYTPYGRYNTRKKIIDYLIDAVGSETPIAFSEGNQILDFIHVDDMASFFSKLFDKISALSKDFYEFHLGTGIGHSLKDVAQIIEKVYGCAINADWGKLPYRANDIMHAVAPISNNLTLLDWKSKISIEDGIAILKEDMLMNVKGGGK